VNIRKLKAVIDANPEWSALTDAQVADELNAQTVTRSIPGGAWVRVRTLYGSPDWTPTEVETLVGKLTAAAESNPVVARVLDWIQQVGDGTGIDVACEPTRVQIAALQAGGVLSETEAGKLLAMGQETVSPAQAAGLGQVLTGHVTKARAL